jgi:hypothetical protein
MKFSAANLLKQALGGQRKWPPFIAQAKLKSHYDVIIVGAGGDGLATAHYLAENHGINNILVLDSGWIGGGKTARNTTIVRSDYLLPASFALKHFALQLWEKQSQDLNFNWMYSPRGYIDLAHSDGELEHFMVRANAMRLGGEDVSMLDCREIAEFETTLFGTNIEIGATLQDETMQLFRLWPHKEYLLATDQSLPAIIHDYDTLMTDISDSYCRFRLSGEHAFEFLASYLSADLLKVDADSACLR